jgi:hypothetical protein
MTKAIAILLLATTALLTGGGAIYFLTGLIFTPWDKVKRIAILLPLMALSIANALVICVLCVAWILRLVRRTTPRNPAIPTRLQTRTVIALLCLVALSLGIPSLFYLVKALTTPDPGLRLIFLPIAAPGLAIAAFCLWRIAALCRLTP